MKKALALMLSVLMVMSLCVVSVSAANVNNWTATTGVLLETDFGDTASAWGSSLTNTIAEPGTTNKVWSNKPGSSHVTEWSDVRAAINSGVVTASFKVKVDGSYAGTYAASGQYPVAEYIHYTPTYVRLVNIANTGIKETGKGGYIALPDTEFTKSSVTETEVADAANAKYHFSADTWHDVKIVVDITNNTTTYYLNNAEIGVVNKAVGNITYFALNSTGINTTANFPLDERNNYPYVMFDNLKIEHSAAVLTSEPTYPVDNGDGSQTIKYLDFNEEADYTLNFKAYSSSGLAAEGEVVNGALSVKKGQWPMLIMPTSETGKIYELSYDIKSSSTSGKFQCYGAAGCSLNLGAYFPGSGFALGSDLGYVGSYAATDNTKTYTVKVEFSTTSDSYMYWSVYDGSTLLYKTKPSNWKDVGGKDVASAMPARIYFGNDSIDECLIDNITLKTLPVNYNYTTYEPQVWVEDLDPETISAIVEGDEIWAQAYGEKGGTLIVAAYNADGTLKAVASSTASQRNRYLYVFDADANFAGAATIKAFFFKGIAGGNLQPITNSVEYVVGSSIS